MYFFFWFVHRIMNISGLLQSLLALIWVQTICKAFQQMSKVAISNTNTDTKGGDVTD